MAPRFIAIFLACGALLYGLFRQDTPTQRGLVTFESSDIALVEGFAWAKHQALAYVHSGDPVGEWYDASLPNRDAFCMRDVSHQTLGAHILGLASVNQNVLRKFTQNISPTRQWCSFWEINKLNLPAPVDYKNDKDFWYNLPSNFDVLHACYRQYLWTRDETYLRDPAFANFYKRTTEDYIRAWDLDGDDIPDALPKYGHRGIPSYNEEMNVTPRQAGDLLATEYSALLAAARLSEFSGAAANVNVLERRAQKIRATYNTAWWNPAEHRFYTAKLQNGSFYAGKAFEPDYFPIYLEQIAESGEHLTGQLQRVLKDSQDASINVEAFSYYPEILYRWRENDQAYRCLCRLISASLPRREYPEVSFAAVGAFAGGLMGIHPDPAAKIVVTLSHLTAATEWARISHVPVFNTEISVKHSAQTETSFTNEGDTNIEWKAEFPTKDGAVSALQVSVPPKQTITVRVTNGRPVTVSAEIFSLRPTPIKSAR